MTRTVYVVDTNVVVSGAIGSDLDSPPVRIFDAMLDGALVSNPPAHSRVITPPPVR